MSFFGLPPPPEPSAEAYRLPPWIGPPDNVLGADFLSPVLLRALGGDVEELFRFGVQLADGSKAVYEEATPFGDQEPAGPVLASAGGGGGGRSWNFAVWLWPLPPPGPLAFVVQWPAKGIPETWQQADAGSIREAAERAEVLWPDGQI
jgi:hypothetical protein